MPFYFVAVCPFTFCGLKNDNASSFFHSSRALLGFPVLATSDFRSTKARRAANHFDSWLFFATRRSRTPARRNVSGDSVAGQSARVASHVHGGTTSRRLRAQ